MKIALVAIAKDEDNYLKEWVDYYLKLGIDDIFVYQNNWRYNGESITNNNVHFEVLDGKRMQNFCYNNFIANMNSCYDYLMCFDIDEFLVVNDCSSIKDAFLLYENNDVVYVNWRIFGDNDLHRSDEFSVLKRFTKCGRKMHRLGKNIINLKRCKDNIMFYNPHIAFNRTTNQLPEYVDTSLNKVVKPWDRVDVPYQKIELFHYRNKTWEENFERKFNKDDVQHDASKCDFINDINAFKREFDAHNMNEVDNFKARDFYFGKQS